MIIAQEIGSKPHECHFFVQHGQTIYESVSRNQRHLQSLPNQCSYEGLRRPEDFIVYDSSFSDFSVQYIFHHLRVIYTALFQRELSSGALICPILRRVSRIIWERGVSQSWSRSALVASSSSTPLLPIGIVPEVDHLQSVNSERHTLLTVLSANISIQSMIEGTNDTLILSTSLQTVLGSLQGCSLLGSYAPSRLSAEKPSWQAFPACNVARWRRISDFYLWQDKYTIWRGVRSDAQLSCTETRFQKCC